MATYTDNRSLANYGVFAGFVAAPLAIAELLIEITRAAFGFAYHGVRKLARAVADRQDRKATMRELSALNDQMLADIGIDRADIPYVVDTLRR